MSRRLSRSGFREESRWAHSVLDGEKNMVWNLRHSCTTHSCGLQNGAELSNEFLVPSPKNRRRFACFSQQVHNTAFIVAGVAWCFFDILRMEFRIRFDKLL